MSVKPTLYQVVLPDGTTATRHSNRIYTHAVAVETVNGWAVSNWCGRHDLALTKQRAILAYRPTIETAILDVVAAGSLSVTDYTCAFCGQRFNSQVDQITAIDRDDGRGLRNACPSCANLPQAQRDRLRRNREVARRIVEAVADGN